MLRNYFKTAIAVLKRRKFFTFISLFGISFTLTLLILIASLVDSVLSVGYPDFNRSRELFVNHLQLTSTKNGSNTSLNIMFPASKHRKSWLFFRITSIPPPTQIIKSWFLILSIPTTGSGRSCSFNLLKANLIRNNNWTMEKPSQLFLKMPATIILANK